MAKKLVIGITISGSTPIISGQLHYFKKQGYDVYLMCPDDEKSRNFCNEEGAYLIPVKIERYISPLKDLFTIFEIQRKLKEINPDIVNVGTPKMGLLGNIGAWIAGVKARVYTCRGLRYEHEKGIKKVLLKNIEWLSGRISHKVICVSHSVRDQSVKDNVFKLTQVQVIGKGSSNGINFEKFHKDVISLKDKEELCSSLKIQGLFVFGFVGRLIDRKGINELYTAFEKVYEKHNNVRLVLVGKKDYSQLKDQYLIQKIEKHPGIKWVGWQNNIPLYLSIYDVFVLPSWWEGFSNAYLEAANMGVPVIGSDANGCRDAIRHNFNGIIVPKKETSPLINAMLFYYHNSDVRKEHGNNGPTWASYFKQEVIWQGQKKIYEELI